MNPITFNFTGAIQNYTVPITGTYDLSAFGAGGGTGIRGAGGSGAQIGGTFNFAAGQQLQIVVGGVGSNGAGPTSDGAGGGGFSAILVNSGANGAYVPLLIAGGGGGGSGTPGPQNAGANAPLFTSGNALGSGGAGGNSGNAANGSGGGGAGALSDGGNGGGSAGWAGGGGFTGPSYAGGQSFSGGIGGFGGGGGGGRIGAGGGGGGSIGGDGGGYSGGYFTGGGGGTSYLSSIGTLNLAETRAGATINTGNGSVRILAPAQPTQPSQQAQSAVPCYVTSTRIRVLRGRIIADVPVERLRVGELVLTALGKPRPIRWIGSRAYPGLTAPQAERPVRIRAGAISDGVPARDLLVSPDHALLVDGLFVAAGHLVNGSSITRGETVTDLTYWHIELDTHDLLLAENTPAESFLAAPGVRVGFDGVQALDAGSHPVPLAPRAELGPELAALRRRLILRADALSDLGRPGTVRAWLDRCATRADGALHVAGWAQDAAQSSSPMCLDIVVDGTIVAVTVAAEYRADIAAAGVGDGRHGFDLGVEAPLAPGMPHVVEVRRSVDQSVICAMAANAAGEWMPLLAA